MPNCWSIVTHRRTLFYQISWIPAAKTYPTEKQWWFHNAGTCKKDDLSLYLPLDATFLCWYLQTLYLKNQNSETHYRQATASHTRTACSWRKATLVFKLCTCTQDIHVQIYTMDRRSSIMSCKKADTDTAKSCEPQFTTLCKPSCMLCGTSILPIDVEHRLF